MRRRRTIAFLIAALLLSLAIPLYVVPNAMGDSFVKTHLSAEYLPVSSVVDVPTFKVQGEGNTILSVGGVGFLVNVTNSYFVPVIISYGPDQLVIYVYNQRVDHPGDQSLNTKLVWNATGAADTGEEDNTRVTSQEDLTQHVLSVPPSGISYVFADQTSAWNGTDYRTATMAAPGDYYVYALAFGRMTGPIIVRVLPP